MRACAVDGSEPEATVERGSVAASDQRIFVISQLARMGHSHVAILEALANTPDGELRAANDWLMEHVS